LTDRLKANEFWELLFSLPAQDPEKYVSPARATIYHSPDSKRSRDCPACPGSECLAAFPSGQWLIIDGGKPTAGAVKHKCWPNVWISI